jgi:hypothetical protein
MAAVGAAPAWGADATVPAAIGDDVATDVPDDVGLGERLALVQWLNDHKDPPKDPEDLAALRHEYNRLAHPDRIAAAATAAAAAATTAPAVSAHRQNLLDQLRKQGVTPDPNLADDQLQKLLDGLAQTQAEDEQRAAKEAAEAAAEAAAHKRAEDEAAAERAQKEQQAASEAAAVRAEEVARLKEEAAKPGTHVDSGPTQPVTQQPAPTPMPPQYAPQPQSQPEQQPSDGIDRSSSAYQAGQATGRFLVWFVILAIFVRVLIRRAGGSTTPKGW